MKIVFPKQNLGSFCCMLSRRAIRSCSIIFSKDLYFFRSKARRYALQIPFSYRSHGPTVLWQLQRIKSQKCHRSRKARKTPRNVPSSCIDVTPDDALKMSTQPTQTTRNPIFSPRRRRLYRRTNSEATDANTQLLVHLYRIILFPTFLKMNFATNAIFLALSCLAGTTSASVCTGNNASPNWYGSVAYPPHFTRNAPEKCPQKYGLSRCEQSAVMMDGTSDFATDDAGVEVCTPNKDCLPTKQNCNDTLVCSDLINLKEELAKGGHNIVCRHEKTFWEQYAGEVKNCHIQANCLDPEVKATQRQLQPEGWRSANAFASSFHEMGIPIGKAYSSAFTRCSQHADLFSDDDSEERLELLYMGGYKEVLALNNITEISKPNALKWQAYNIRNFAGKKPSPGTNNVMITHGFNIKLGFGTAVDEGYCMILKPDDMEPSLAESIGSLTVANRVFEFDDDSFPVDAIARMSPESAVYMQTCDDVRSDAMGQQGEDDVLAIYDTNHDMKITKEEFEFAHGALENSADAFDFVRSIQPDILGKPNDGSTDPSIELGQFFRLNWGWREFFTTGGGIAYPWREILENTIGSGGNTSSERVAAFKQANAVLTGLIIALKDQDLYPSKKVMEEKLINCNSNGIERQHLADCASGVFFAESGDDSPTPLSGGESIFGIPLAYPSEWKPSADFYESKSLKVASCLVAQGSLSLSQLSDAMGCSAADSKTLPISTTSTSETLAWVLGALFACCLLGMAYTFFIHVPDKLKESKKFKDLTDNQVDLELEETSPN